MREKISESKTINTSNKVEDIMEEPQLEFNKKNSPQKELSLNK